MKKGIMGFVLGVAITISPVAFAEVGDVTAQEFMSPVVQTIFNLLHEEITELRAELAECQGEAISSDPKFGSMSDDYAIDVSVRAGEEAGQMVFTIDQPYTKAMLTYYPISNPAQVVRTGGLFNGGPAVAGWFRPETTYAWKVEATDESGKTALAEGIFTTGQYAQE